MENFRNHEEVVMHVDENNNQVGAVSRKEMRSKNLWHRASYVFVENSLNQFVV